MEVYLFKKRCIPSTPVACWEPAVSFPTAIKPWESSDGHASPLDAIVITAILIL